ncbi:uncharacterized protein LOC117173405 [Belonocnema kinseyi]|uniref:uncharacterized protein LOC117173405 n=1 Tax=Belonocnema kinseyi TaxID=2817044 RepID=UPI00143D9F4A|nr:uncharacterized protein LOC117173405 [Belonocnema kinseyi]
MYLLYVLSGVLCATSVLTLATKKEKKLDREVENPNNLSSTIENIADPKSDDAAQISPAKMALADKMKSSLPKINIPAMEGGGITHDIDQLPVKEAPFSPKIPEEILSSTPLSITERAVVARKQAPLPDPIRDSIKPRKGVENETNFNEIDSSSEDPLSKFDQSNSSIVPPSSSSPSLNKENTTQKAATYSSSTTKNSPSTKTWVSEAPKKVSTDRPKKHKLKPTVTIGGSNVDEPIPASPTKTPPLGMPRKIDYIVPVMITIFALPLLGVATYILYRRGRDCWDKRHYRRMDFLIDGMYNE